MDGLLNELAQGLPDASPTVRVLVRLVAGALLGGVVGIERERIGKSAGLRTHMLVALGAAVFVVVPVEVGMSLSDLSRVIQGLAAGIGFIGGGAILKLSNEQEIHGLTTAAGIWMTAAVGVAAGLGSLGPAAIGTLLAWTILSILGRIEHRVEKGREAKA